MGWNTELFLLFALYDGPWVIVGNKAQLGPYCHSGWKSGLSRNLFIRKN